ncbi:porin [Glaciimonas soli]|uniref:Porin n=1 Tax=Glaciimonas soli TaxID=2590999 RepID=A0A843Z0M6_9BURK|nr:porin [Glaciimonas soli]MQR02396.1 porin [Glaciimonas soli]
MKKSLIALSVLGACAITTTNIAQAQSSVTIYGLIDTSISYNNKIATPSADAPRATGSKLGVDSGDLQQSRFGFKGVEDLGGGMKALFILEGGFSGTTGASTQGGLLFGRTSVVGLSGGYGTVQLGRRKDFIDEIATYYSSVYDFGLFINGVHDNNLDRVGGNRANNQIRYDTKNIAGFTANATYGFGEAAGSTSSGQSIGLGANYDNGPFGIGFGYWQSKLGSTAYPSSDQGACVAGHGKVGDTCIKTWMLGSSYKTGPFRIYGAWSKTMQPLATFGGNTASFDTKFTPGTIGAPTSYFSAAGANNNSTNVFDLGLDYQLTGTWKLITSVLQSRYSFVGTDTKGRLTQINLGADYALSKRTDIYSYYANLRASNMYNPGIVGGASGVANTQNAITLGIRHKF